MAATCAARWTAQESGRHLRCFTRRCISSPSPRSFGRSAPHARRRDDPRSRMRHRCRWCRMGARVPVDAGSRRHRSPPVGDRRSTVDLSAARRSRSSSSGRRRALAGPRRGEAVVAAYVLNELPDAVGITVEKRLLETVERGGRVLVIEPIARAITPWWDDAAAFQRVRRTGGRVAAADRPAAAPPEVRSRRRDSITVS